MVYELKASLKNEESIDEETGDVEEGKEVNHKSTDGGEMECVRRKHSST